MQRQQSNNQINIAVHKLLLQVFAHASTHQRSQNKYWDHPSTFLHADTFEAVSYGTVWAGKISHLCILPYAHSEAVIRQSEVMLVPVAHIHVHLCFLNLLRLALHLRPFGLSILDVYTPWLVEDVTVTLKCLWCFVAVKCELRWECHPHISALICQRWMAFGTANFAGKIVLLCAVGWIVKHEAIYTLDKSERILFEQCCPLKWSACVTKWSDANGIHSTDSCRKMIWGTSSPWRCWQSVQWQYLALTGSLSAAYWTSPHMQLAVYLTLKAVSFSTSL